MLDRAHQGKIEQVIAWLEEALDSDREALVDRLYAVLLRMMSLVPGGHLVDAAFIESLDLEALRREVDAGLAPAASQRELLATLEAALEAGESAQIFPAFRELLLKLAHDNADRPLARSEDE